MVKHSEPIEIAVARALTGDARREAYSASITRAKEIAGKILDGPCNELSLSYRINDCELAPGFGWTITIGTKYGACMVKTINHGYLVDLPDDKLREYISMVCLDMLHGLIAGIMKSGATSGSL